MTVTDAQHLPSSTFECVEIYVPKRLENVAKLYAFLQAKLIDRKRGEEQAVTIDGFSLYEVDGAFYGHEIYQERTIVVRILFDRTDAESDQSLTEKIQSLGRDVAGSVAIDEEEIWISHYPQNVVIVRQSRSSSAS